MLSRIADRARRALADRRGTSVIEFAISLPIMLILLLGSIEMPRAMIAANRASYLADNMAQMISQTQATIDTPTMHRYVESAPLIDTGILDYARQVGRQDVWNLANINVTSVLVSQADPACRASVCAYRADVVFSAAFQGATRSCGQLTSSASNAYAADALPANLFQPGALIVVDVVTSYQPLFTMFFNGTITFHRSAYFRPRYVPRVDYADGATSHNCPGYTP